MHIKGIKTSLAALLFLASACTQTPSVKPSFKIDLSQAGRNENQVGEFGYQSWNDYASKPSLTIAGITLTFANIGKHGEGLKSTWYKAGIAKAKLANDGLSIDGGEAGAAVKLSIDGLPVGEHTLLIYLNNIDSPISNTFAPIDISVDGVLVVDDIQPTVRIDSNADAQTAYLKLSATAEKTVEVCFAADENSQASNKNVVICGLELNTPNPKEQADKAYPADGDEHVNGDNGSVKLAWRAAENALAHRVYLAESKEGLQCEEAFRGELEQKETSFEAKNLDPSKKYFWRIDELRADGKITPGDVWYFRLRQLAFPGAEGYGRFARGGRGGVVVEVSNLNDDGPGSFREAVNKDVGPRTIVFTVGGNIELKSRLVINQPYITVAGQTAPGQGITITRAPVGLTGNDNIMRFMRVRIGAGKTYDGMGLTGANHSIIDHASISWTIDESFSSRGAHHISLQRTLISEALNKANHHKYGEGKMHGFAATVGGDIGSFHHNLLAHCYGRNWSIGGGLDGDGFYTGRVDIRNNVVYNWGRRATDGGAREVNFVGNYYKPGAATSFFYALNMQHEGVGKGMQRAYFEGNVMPGHFDEASQEKGRKASYSHGDTSSYETFLKKPFFDSQVNTQSAKAAYKDVLSDVGCRLPVLDLHDRRIIKETIDGTYTYMGKGSQMGGMIDTEQDVGGFPNYKSYKRAADFDTDHDGLPNWWEEARNTHVNSAQNDFSDANADANANGYTDLEDYLNWLAEPHFFLQENCQTNFDLSRYFKGYEATGATYQVVSMQGDAAFNLEGSTLQVMSKKTGFCQLTIVVSDKEGDSKTQAFHFFVQAAR